MSKIEVFGFLNFGHRYERSVKWVEIKYL